MSYVSLSCANLLHGNWALMLYAQYVVVPYWQLIFLSVVLLFRVPLMFWCFANVPLFCQCSVFRSSMFRCSWFYSMLFEFEQFSSSRLPSLGILWIWMLHTFNLARKNLIPHEVKADCRATGVLQLALDFCEIITMLMKDLKNVTCYILWIWLEKIWY